MAKYKGGDITHKNIYKVARSMFYEFGYKSTSCLKIAKAAGVNIALISYHFKNKLNLGLEICNEFTNNIRDIIMRKTLDAGFDYEPIIGIAVEFRVFDQLLHNNNNYGTFIKEFCDENGLLLSDHYIGINLKYIETKYNIHLSENDGKIAHYTITSMISGMISLMHKGYISEEEYQIEKGIDNMLKILDFEKEERFKIIEKSLDIFNNIQVSMIDNFRVE